MNWKGGAETVCPFYKRESKYMISCEGFYGETELVTRFKKANDKDKWQKKVCFQMELCALCPVHSLLEAKYESLSTSTKT